MEFMCEFSVECDGNNTVPEVNLTFVQSRYIMRIYIPMMIYVGMEKRFINEQVKYLRRLQRVFATGSFRLPSMEKN